MAIWADDAALGLVFTDMWLEDEQGRRRRRSRCPATGRRDRWLELVMRFAQFQPSDTVLCRGVWDTGRRAWPEHPGGAGDLVLTIDAARAGWPMCWLDEPLAIYHGHRGQPVVCDAAPAAKAMVLSAYHFDEDPVAERACRRRLASVQVACTGVHLRERHGAEARRSLNAARAMDRRADRPRRLVVRGLASYPRLAPAAVWRLGRRRA